MMKKENYIKTITESETKTGRRDQCQENKSQCSYSNKSRRPYGVAVLLENIDNLKNHRRYETERISKCLHFLFCVSIPFKMITKHWQEEFEFQAS